MKTPFVAHPPSILVIHATDTVVLRCKAAGAAIGLPVRVALDAAGAAEIAHSTRPLVLVCDAATGIADASLTAHLAGQIEAAFIQVEADEPPDLLAERFRSASGEAETARTARATLD